MRESGGVPPACLLLIVLAAALPGAGPLTFAEASPTDLSPPWNSSWSDGFISYWQTNAGMPSDSFLSVSFDPVGKTIYAGSMSGLVGLNLTSLDISVWNKSAGLLGDEVLSLEVDGSSRRVFFGTWDGGIQAIDILTGDILPVCPDRRYLTWDLHRPRESARLYAGTDRGLLICDPVSGTSELVNSTSGLLHDNVWAVYADPGRGRVYIGGDGGSSLYFETNGSVLSIAGLPGASDIEADATAESIFLGTGSGVFVLNATSLEFEQYRWQYGVTNPIFDAIAYDRASDALYASVRFGGMIIPERPPNSVIDILQLDDLTVSHVTTEEGLPGGEIRDATYDDTTHLVFLAARAGFGSGGGLVVLDPSAPDLQVETSRLAERLERIALRATVVDPDGITTVIATYIDVRGVEASALLRRTTGDVFEVALAAQHTEGVVRYRISAQDTQGRVSVSPSFDEWDEIAVEDTTPPRVVGWGPVGDALVDSEIFVTFSERIDLLSVNSSIAIIPRTEIEDIIPLFETLFLRPAALAYERQYWVEIEDTITDVYGNRLDGDGDGAPGGGFSWSFVTARQPTPPRVRTVLPTEARAGEAIPVQVWTQDEDGVAWVILSYEDVTGESQILPLSFAGPSGDEGLWLAEIPAQPTSGTLYVRVSAQDAHGATVAHPSEGSLTIEVMERRGSSIPDVVPGVGLTLIGLVAALLVFFYLRERRRQKE